MAGLFTGWVLVHAQPVDENLPQITGTIALTNARVITAAGKDPVTENVILRDGLISAMGPQAIIPNDAYVLAADSFFVYPAFIDAISYIGIKEPEGNTGRRNQPGPPGQDAKPLIDEEGNASLEETGITPFKHVRASFDPKEKSISDWRAQGFAVAHIVPHGKMIPGQGAIIILSGDKADHMIWKEDISFFGQWVGAGNLYPSTIIGVMAKWRELYRNASQDLIHQADYANNTMVSRPPYNQAHDALIPLVKKEVPLYFRAPGMKDMSRALAMQSDLGMNMVIADAQEAYYLTEQIKSKKIPLILSLDLPDDTSDSKTKGDRKRPEGEMKEGMQPDTLKQTSPDSTKKDPEKIAFEQRRVQSLREHQEQAGTLAKESIPFSFGTMSGSPADFFKTLQTMIERGLDPNTALNALTLQPAKLLGIEKYCGTLETGKMANLIISNKPIFEKNATIRYMVVEGVLYAYEEKEKKKMSDHGKANGNSSLAGTWSYSIEIPDETREGTFEFSKEGKEWKGKISSKEITSGNDKLKNVVVDGSSVSFTYDLDIGGEIVEIEFELELDGDQLAGTVTVGEAGTFQVKSRKTAEPN